MSLPEKNPSADATGLLKKFRYNSNASDLCFHYNSIRTGHGGIFNDNPVSDLYESKNIQTRNRWTNTAADVLQDFVAANPTFLDTTLENGDKFPISLVLAENTLELANGLLKTELAPEARKALTDTIDGLIANPEFIKTVSKHEDCRTIARHLFEYATLGGDKKYHKDFLDWATGGQESVLYKLRPYVDPYFLMRSLDSQGVLRIEKHGQDESGQFQLQINAPSLSGEQKNYLLKKCLAEEWQGTPKDLYLHTPPANGISIVTDQHNTLSSLCSKQTAVDSTSLPSR